MHPDNVGYKVDDIVDNDTDTNMLNYAWKMNKIHLRHTYCLLCSRWTKCGGKKNKNKSLYEQME